MGRRDVVRGILDEFRELRDRLPANPGDPELLAYERFLTRWKRVLQEEPRLCLVLAHAEPADSLVGKSARERERELRPETPWFRLLNIETSDPDPHLIREIGRGAARLIAVNHNEKWALMVGERNSLTKWCLLTGESLVEWRGPEASSERVDALVALDDGPGELAVTIDADGRASFWDAASGQIIGEWKLPQSMPLVAAALSRHSPHQILFADAENYLHLGTVPDPAPIKSRMRTSRNSRLVALALSPDGRHAVTAERSGWVVLWDLAQFPSLQGMHRTILTHDDQLTRLAVDWDRQLVATGCRDKRLRVAGWNGWPDRPIEIACGGEIAALAWDRAHGRLIVAADRDEGARLGICACAEGASPCWLDSEAAAIDSVSVSPEGLSAVTHGGPRGFRHWDLPFPKPPARGPLRRGSDLNLVAVSGDGRTGLTGHTDGHLEIHALNGTFEAPVRLVPKHSGPVIALALTPDGGKAVSRDASTMFLWDLGLRPIKLLKQVRTDRLPQLDDKSGDAPRVNNWEGSLQPGRVAIDYTDATGATIAALDSKGGVLVWSASRGRLRRFEAYVVQETSADRGTARPKAPDRAGLRLHSAFQEKNDEFEAVPLGPIEMPGGVPLSTMDPAPQLNRRRCESVALCRVPGEMALYLHAAGLNIQEGFVVRRRLRTNLVPEDIWNDLTPLPAGAVPICWTRDGQVGFHADPPGFWRIPGAAAGASSAFQVPGTIQAAALGRDGETIRVFAAYRDEFGQDWLLASGPPPTRFPLPSEATSLAVSDSAPPLLAVSTNGGRLHWFRLEV